ncbi:MAG: insulinase family protein [Acidobacteria bacterium]|nr:insulinase family protein [Acidobacteriota bacterium]
MFWKRLLVSVLAVLLIAPSLPALAQKSKKAMDAGGQSSSAAGKGGRTLPSINYTEFKLPNGLRVILHEDHSTPVVGVNLWYHVGSKNEVPGRTGFAHLFEHMMFQGSKNYDDDYFTPLQEAGAVLNGSTNPDRTNYWEVVPKNFLELALFMEADRMGGLLEAMTQAKLDNQRDVVKNEKRQNYDNQPYGLVRAKINEAMYPPAHPYHWLTIGSLDDLTAASLDDVKGFFRRFYVPNNASLAIAGDFDPAQARRLVEKHFGPIPRGPASNPVSATQPQLDKEVRLALDDRVQLPRAYMVWHSVPAYAKDDAALDTLATILGGGKSSRLYKSLVYDKQIAQSVSAFNGSQELAGLFQIVATAKPGTTAQQLEDAINAELAKVKTAPPTAEEVERAYNSIEANFVYGIQTVGGFGGKNDQLNQYATFRNKPGYFDEDLARYRMVKAADVRRVANTYLSDKRLVVTVVPRAAGGGTTSATGPAPQSPREAIATPSAQTAGAPQSGTPNAASQQPRTGTGQGTGAGGTDRPAGAQVITKAEAAATQPGGGAAPPVTAAPGATSRQTATPRAGAQKKKEKKPTDASKLPKPGPDPTVSLPPVERRTLSNGLQVLVVQHHELPVVHMNLVVKMGAAGDPQGHAGLATLTADMLDEGTKTRDALAISDQLAFIGSSLSTGAGWDSTTANLTTLTRHLDRALDIFSDVILNPAFPSKDLQRLRSTRMTGFRQRRDSPDQIAGLVYSSLIYGRNHPYGHPLSGDEESLGAIKDEDVRAFYETYFRPNNSTLIVVGDVTPDALMPKLERAFSKWERGHVPAVDVTAAPTQRDRTTIYVVDRPGSAQSVISVGHVGVPRSNQDFFPLVVLNTMLGGQFTSRINMNLREDKGYSYGARSSFDFRRGAGPFVVNAPVVTAATKESVVEVLKELRGIRGEIPVTPQELEFSKQAIIRGFPRGFETPEQIAGRMETVVTYDLPDDYYNAYIQRVQAVTLEDIKRVAERYVDPSRMAVVIVGDRRVIEQSLRSLEDLGETVTFLDAEGRPAPAGGTTSGGSQMRQ